MSAASRDPLPILAIKSGPNNGHLVKKHKKLCKNSIKNRPFQGKKSYGGGGFGRFGTFFKQKIEN